MSKLLSYLRFSAALFCLVVLVACQTLGGTGLIQSEVTAVATTRCSAQRSRRPCGKKAMLL
mgnify:CR=1 FL=1